MGLKDNFNNGKDALGDYSAYLREIIDSDVTKDSKAELGVPSYNASALHIFFFLLIFESGLRLITIFNIYHKL